MYKLKCEMCKKGFDHQFNHTKTCSDRCRKKRYHEVYGITGTGLPTNFLGKLNEYVVMCDLGKRGFDVYPAAFPQQKYDILIKDRSTEETFVVEVKTGYRRSNGAITRPKHPHEGWDYLAVVHSVDQITYINKEDEEVEPQGV